MGLFDFLVVVEEFIANIIVKTGLTVPPGSGLLLLFVSLLINALSGLVNRLVIDMEKLGKETREMAEHQKNKRIAMETEDKKLWIRVKRNEERYLELQKNTAMARMIPSLVTIGPFIFLFRTLRIAFQQAENISLNGRDSCTNSCGVVTILPFKVNRDLPLIGKWFSEYAQDSLLSVAGFGFWYFLSAIVVSTLLQRLFGINLTGMQNPMQQR